MPEEEFDQVELLEKSLPKEWRCSITYYPEWDHVYYDGDMEPVEKVKQEMMRGSRQSRLLVLSILLNIVMWIFISFLVFIG